MDQACDAICTARYDNAGRTREGPFVPSPSPASRGAQTSLIPTIYAKMVHCSRDLTARRSLYLMTLNPITGGHDVAGQIVVSADGKTVSSTGPISLGGSGAASQSSPSSPLTPLVVSGGSGGSCGSGGCRPRPVFDERRVRPVSSLRSHS
jgi:hypothetical protein